MYNVIVHKRLWCYLCTLFTAVPSPPAVRINPYNGVALAGESFAVNCSVIPQEGIMYDSNTLTVMWSRDGGSPLPDGKSSGPLIFISPVLTSHGGLYTCTARLYISEAGVNVTETNTTVINIQSMKNILPRVYVVSLCLLHIYFSFF